MTEHRRGADHRPTLEWTAGHFIGGHVVLDFCNTVHRRTPEPGADLIPDAGSLDRWLVATETLRPSSGSIDAVTARRATALRSVLWQAFDAHREGEGPAPSVVAAIVEHAHDPGGAVRIDERGAVSVIEAGGVPAALALGALQLILHPPTPSIRACDSCGWFFIDSSRGQRRRWCSMRLCGNEHKVAQYRARRSAGRRE